MRFIEILCEGYHDRAFWKGILTSSRIEERRDHPRDGVRITGGQYGYCLANEISVIVSPCHGKTNLPSSLRTRLKTLSTKPLDHLIVNMDTDTVMYDPKPCHDLIRNEMNKADNLQIDHELLIVEGCRLHPVVWGDKGPECEGIPRQQTLERMACSAMLEAYPERGAVVSSFLTAEPTSPVIGPKHHAWSYMAKWSADRGCEDFYSALWEDEQIKNALIEIMTGNETWSTLEQVLGV